MTSLKLVIDAQKWCDISVVELTADKHFISGTQTCDWFLKHKHTNLYLVVDFQKRNTITSAKDFTTDNNYN